MRVSVAPRLCLHLVLSVICISAILISAEISCFNLYFLMTYVVKYVFICLIVTFISSLERCLLKSFSHFLIRWFVFFLLRILRVIWKTIFIMCVLHIFSLHLWFIFSFSYQYMFHKAKIFHFNEVLLINYFFNGLCSCVVSKK